MPKQTLTDREMLTDALSSEKFMTENYNTYANEWELQKRGWYPTQSAPAEKVQQAKMKFSNLSN